MVVRAQSLNHWTTRELPPSFSYSSCHDLPGEELFILMPQIPGQDMFTNSRGGGVSQDTKGYKVAFYLPRLHTYLIYKSEIELPFLFCVCACLAVSLRDCHGLWPPGSSVYGIFQARILDWVAISYSRGSSQPRDWPHVSFVSCTDRQILYH